MKIDDQEKIHRYYQALLDRDESYTGVFYVGVKTTSIFCIATCRARKPKQKNVDFYTTLKSVVDAGYRPCKVCKPTHNAHVAPLSVSRALELVYKSPYEKISDSQLKAEGIRPEQVRRWFNKHYGMTFQAYQRMYRINNAMIALKQGNKAIDTALDSGYHSVSGFGYTYKKYIGRSPKQSMNDSILLINRFTTPLGPMFVCASDIGVCLLEFVDRRMLEAEFKDLQKLLNATILPGENEHIKQAKQEVDEYFAGTRTTFNTVLHTPGTDFRQSVWHSLTHIPYGSTVSYQQQAESLNKPRAVRAVASANGQNRIAIIIPCHRVIGKNGSLTGYAGGLERKRWLLDHELKYCV